MADSNIRYMHHLHHRQAYSPRWTKVKLNILKYSGSDLLGGAGREYLGPCPPHGRSLMGVTWTRPRPTPRHAPSPRTRSPLTTPTINQ